MATSAWTIISAGCRRWTYGAAALAAWTRSAMGLRLSLATFIRISSGVVRRPMISAADLSSRIRCNRLTKSVFAPLGLPDPSRLPPRGIT
jgi:hypothetical protein